MSEPKHGFADPAPSGLVALALVVIALGALFNGWISPMALPLLACWQFGAFVIQLITAMIELKEGNIVGGNVFSYFAGFFMLTGAIESMVKYILIIHKLPFDPRIDGWTWLVLAFFLTCDTIGYLLGSKVIFFMLCCADVALWFIAISNLGLVPAVAVSPIIGWFLIFNGVLAAWGSIGGLLNGAFKKEVIPLGKPFITVD